MKFINMVLRQQVCRLLLIVVKYQKARFIITLPVRWNLVMRFLRRYIRQSFLMNGPKDDGDQHGDRAKQIAPDRCPWMGKTLKAQDKQDPSDHVRQVNERMLLHSGLLFLSAKHFQHAIGHHKASHDINRGHH